MLCCCHQNTTQHIEKTLCCLIPTLDHLSCLDQPRYVISDRASPCPSGYGVIDSESECRAACLFLGWETDTHGSRSGQSMYPYGCIENTSYCYFNSDVTDSNHSDRSRVCELNVQLSGKWITYHGQLVTLLCVILVLHIWIEKIFEQFCCPKNLSLVRTVHKELVHFG